MKGSSIFHIAIDAATQKRDAAQMNLVQVERNRVFAQGQMDQLTNYATETEARWLASAQISAYPELLRHHYQFMDRLRKAIDLQQTVLLDVGSQIDEARKHLMSLEIRLRSLELMLEKSQAVFKRKQARREQVQMDEFAALQHARKRVQPIHGDTL